MKNSSSISALLTLLLTCLPNAYSGELTQVLNGLFCPDTISPSGSQQSAEDRLLQLYRLLLGQYKSSLDSQERYLTLLGQLTTSQNYFDFSSGRSHQSTTADLIVSLGQILQKGALPDGTPINSERVRAAIELHLKKEMHALQGTQEVVEKSIEATKAIRVASKALHGHASQITSLQFSGEGSRFYSGEFNGKVIQWDLTSLSSTELFQGNNFDRLKSISLQHNRALFVSAHNGLKIVDLKTKNPIQGPKAKANHAIFNAIANSDHTQVLAPEPEKHSFHLWDFGAALETRAFVGHADRVHDIKASPDFQWAISASSDKTLIVWDIPTRTPKYHLTGHTDVVELVETNREFTMAISASHDFTLRTWRIKEGKQDQILIGHKNKVTYLQVSPNFERALSGSIWEPHPILWNPTTGEKLIELQGDASELATLAVDPEVKRALLVKKSGMFEFWNLEEKKMIGSFMSNDRTSRIALSPDSKFAISGDYYGNILLWDLEMAISEQRGAP